MGDITDGVNAVFYMSMATLFFGSVAMCFRMCYKSKCSEVNFGCLKIKRDVNIEKEEDLNMIKKNSSEEKI